jgi:RNA recognition motif-containing protein
MSRLFLGNIPNNITRDEVVAWVQSYGFHVEDVDIIADRITGLRRGFCFANLVDETVADSAINTLNGKIMRGRVITVNHAVPLKPRAIKSQRKQAA